MKIRVFLISLALLAVFMKAGNAACSGATNGTPQTFAFLNSNDFQNGRAAGAVTVDCMRDIIASTYGSANNNINLKNLQLPTGGDDTAAINAAAASLLPASFTGTGSAVVNVLPDTEATLTMTGSPGGTIAVGMLITGTGVPNGEFVSRLGTGTGGAGTYFVSKPFAFSSATLTFQPPATGAVIYAPAGTYIHAGVINLNGVCLVGDGMKTIFRATDTTSPNPQLAVKVSGQNACLRNVQLTTSWVGSRQSAPEAAGVFINGATHFVIADNVIQANFENAIANIGGTFGKIAYNSAYNTQSDAYYTAEASHDILEIGNSIEGAGDDCYSVDSYTGDSGPNYNIRIEANYCSDGLARGLEISGGHDIVEVGNQLVNILSRCFFIASESGSFNTRPVDSVTFVGNSCVGVQDDAIWIDGSTNGIASNITISNNIFTGVTGGLMHLGQGTNFTKNVTLIGNTFSGTASDSGVGVNIGGVTNLTLIGNSISNVGYEAVVDVGGNGDSGYVIIDNNNFNTTSIQGAGFANLIKFAGTTFSSLHIHGNTQTNAGATVASFLNIAGVPAVSIEGNFGDNHTETVTGATSGYFFNPYGTNTNYGSPRVDGGTKFTASGCTNSATVGSGTAGKLTLGAVSCAVVVTLNGAAGMTAPNGWGCAVSDQTHPTALISQTASSATTATLTVPGSPAAISDVVVFGCQPY